jgi:hypothetical protein
VPLKEDDPTVEVAVFGAQVEQFLDSQIGQYLVKRAQDAANAALEALATANPEDPAGIRKLQNKVVVADLVVSWLSEAILLGDQAEQELRTRDLQ